MIKQHCYNKGCGQTFEPEENSDGICIYHSGEPYFHDAYKEWTCCKKKTTDFTEFLNIKGCTQGKHNGVRPSTLDKPKIISDDKVLETVENILSKCTALNDRSNKEIVELQKDLPLVNLTPEISPRLLQQISTAATLNDEISTSDDKIPVGTICKNSGCALSHDVGISENCVHHPGSAIFHEGLKYWSCCRKMTSDFSKFLEQTGCTTGKHLWFKDKVAVQCREDWHQTGTSVVVSIFCKNYDPHKSIVSLSPTCLRFYVYYPQDGRVFEKQYELFGVVKVDASRVSMLPTKIEIRLMKTIGEHWKRLSV